MRGVFAVDSALPLAVNSLPGCQQMFGWSGLTELTYQQLPLTGVEAVQNIGMSLSMYVIRLPLANLDQPEVV
jgi:hypothetical protein